MKNYIAEAITIFDDYEGQEIKPENPKTRRNVGDLFNCTKERFEYLKRKGLVILKGINKEPEEIKEPIETKKATTTKKTTTAKKTTTTKKTKKK